MDANHQCPFVNRPDSRCSGRLSIDSLEHAFAHCFSAYNTCPVYVERLLERRVRQISRPVTDHGKRHDDGTTLIQLRTPAARRAAGAA
jgi:hypothetical protein